MRRFTLVSLAVGVALLGVVLAHTDLAAVAEGLARLRWPALAVLAAVFAAGLAAEASSWLLTIPSVPHRPRWLVRVGGVLLYGSALEMVTLGGVGGEPVKVVLLRRHGVPVHEAVASLMLSRLTDVIALVAFLAVGVWVMLRTDAIPPSWRLGVVGALGLLVAAGIAFFAAQRLRPLSRLAVWLLERWPRGRVGGERAAGALGLLADIEGALGAFHRRHRVRLALSAAGSLGEWVAGTAAVYVTVAALGEPVRAAEALVIQALVLLVRAVFFFVPADVGTQEGAFVVAGAVLLGSPAIGLVLAAVHRARDLGVLLVGLGIGAAYALSGSGGSGSSTGTGA